MAHFIAGFVLIISTVLRYIYGLVWGNRYSRELIIVPVWSKAWWSDLWQDVRWYLFLNKECGAHAQLKAKGRGVCERHGLLLCGADVT